VTRRIIDPQAAPPRYVPVLNLGGLVPGLRLDTPSDEFQMMFGTRSFFGWTATPDGDTVWFANPPHRAEPARGEIEAMTDADWRRRLLELVGDDAGPMRQIIERAPAPLVAWTTYDVPRVENWHRGNMIIIGDAAHATSPSSGQGASLALEDAVTLGKAIRDNASIPEAFAAYEALRRERVEKIVAAGARTSNTRAAGPVARVVRDAMLPVIFALASRNDGASSRWITDHHIDWEG
jgi:FAD-dependent urate hydroxylase